jgi:hypothetical protein
LIEVECVSVEVLSSRRWKLEEGRAGRPDVRDGYRWCRTLKMAVVDVVGEIHSSRWEWY